jgi:hypothetical protein
MIFQPVGKERMAWAVTPHVTTVCLRNVTMLKVSVWLKTRVNQVIWVQSAIKVFYNLSFYNYLLPTNLFGIVIETIWKYIVKHVTNFKSQAFS